MAIRRIDTAGLVMNAELSGPADAAVVCLNHCFASAASEAMCGLNTTGRLAEITVPSMVVATPHDPGASREVSEKMARLIPECELHWLEPARHLASLEHPERFNELLRSFLGRQHQ